MDLENKWGDYSRIFSLMNSLSKYGHKIFILTILPSIKTPRVTYFKECNIDVIEIHPPQIHLPGKKGLSRHFNNFLCIPTIQKEASKINSKNKLDLVYSLMPGSGSSYPANKIKNKYNIPLVLDLADMYSFIRPKYILKKSFQDADKIIVITNYLKEKLLSKNISNEKIVRIPNGVDLELFNKKISIESVNRIREKFNSDKIIMFSGALQDLSIIIESANFVIKKIPSVKFVIIGDHRDPNKNKFVWEKIVKKNKLEKNFIFLGKIDKKMIPKYLLSADVCVDSFPDYPYFAAAHPIKLLEYGACAKPIVATNVSETANLIEHNKFGLLAEPNNPSQYADYLIELLEKKTFGETLGLNFNNFIEKNLTWSHLAEIFEDEIIHKLTFAKNETL